MDGFGYNQTLEDPFNGDFSLLNHDSSNFMNNNHNNHNESEHNNNNNDINNNNIENVTSNNLIFDNHNINMNSLNSEIGDDSHNIITTSANKYQESVTSSHSNNFPSTVVNKTSNSSSESPSKLKRKRAKGETLNILKKEFDMNPSPTIQQRKEISKLIGMPEKSVTIWFQNRRAKFKKKKLKENDKNKSKKRRKSLKREQKQNDRSDNERDNDEEDEDDEEDLEDDSDEGEYTKQYNDNYSSDNIDDDNKLTFFDRVPLNLNKNYYLIDVCSITVGTWNRMKSGSIPKKRHNTIKDLRNLSPQSVNNIMVESTDLVVLISKKNFEVNYFFSAMANNTKILFRIFYSIDSITNCSLCLENDDAIVNGQKNDNNSNSNNNNLDTDGFGELKLTVDKSPNFAVYFLNENSSHSSNQWSICEDFSEGKQVNDAFVGGSNLPHILKGIQGSLRFINSLILDYKSTNQIIQPPTVQPNQRDIPISMNLSLPETLSLNTLSDTQSQENNILFNNSTLPLQLHYNNNHPNNSNNSNNNNNNSIPDSLMTSSHLHGNSNNNQNHQGNVSITQHDLEAINLSSSNFFFDNNDLLTGGDSILSTLNQTSSHDTGIHLTQNNDQFSNINNNSINNNNNSSENQNINNHPNNDFF